MKHLSTVTVHHAAPRHGFGMVELMVALLVASILAVAIGQVFLASGRSYRIHEQLARLTENGRYALEVLVTDLRRAGHLGILNGRAAITDRSAGGVSDGYRTAIENGRCMDIDWVRMLSHRVFGKDDNRGGYDCLPSEPVPVGDVLVTRYAAPRYDLPPAGAMAQTVVHPDHLYLLARPDSSTVIEGRRAGTLLSGGITDSVAELVAHGYFIRTSTTGSGCPAVNSLPALYRLAQSGNRLVAREIARGIEQFQVQYGIDSNSDGTVDRYMDAMDASHPGWQQVIAVRIWLLARAECPETGYDNTQHYALGNVRVHPATTDRDSDGVIDGDVDGDGNDDYRRRLMSTTVTLRNPRDV
ncbi:MAG: PilW family protein [Gammaproteobacteria bacterium]